MAYWFISVCVCRQSKNCERIQTKFSGSIILLALDETISGGCLPQYYPLMCRTINYIATSKLPFSVRPVAKIVKTRRQTGRALTPLPSPPLFPLPFPPLPSLHSPPLPFPPLPLEVRPLKPS